LKMTVLLGHSHPAALDALLQWCQPLPVESSLLSWRSVFVYPGFAEFTLIYVPRSSYARWTVNMFQNAFDAL
jgi:hypothetical protein